MKQWFSLNSSQKTKFPLNNVRPQIPLFERDPDGNTGGSKYIMGRRNWCSARYDNNLDELIFDIRVEKEKGYGTTVGFVSVR